MQHDGFVLATREQLHFQQSAVRHRKREYGSVVEAKAFIDKWQGVNASELATSQSFLIDLCELLGVEKPHPSDEQSYEFERPVTFTHGDGSTSAGRIDLYRRGCFILESKKIRGSVSKQKMDDALLRARSQAENYARALPAEEGRPPFLIVVDVGHRLELYSEFSRSGATYTPFPDPQSHRIPLADLLKEDVRERLRAIWLDPLHLDPSRHAAKVTREIATKLANLAKSLESTGIEATRRAGFLQRCLFTMFAEDVGLLPEDAFRNLLQTHREQPDTAMRMLSALWADMDRGGFSAVLASDVLHFNGKLFKTPESLPLNQQHIDLLIEASKADWTQVEPAIFGTLLERALDPKERHKLGAHYTPRAYVERLVLPTVIEPLREEWEQAHAAALVLSSEGKESEAAAELRRFHHRLCNVRVLDPACGSGNFLYVTLEHLKRIEGEVLNALDELGDTQTGLALEADRFDSRVAETVDPHNLLGIEKNPRAAAIAELVLWIGYLQWHFKTRGNVNPPQPVIRDFKNIENRDAVLDWDEVEFDTDESGKPKTRWDGVTMKVSPVTGKDVPDESAQIPIERYINPRKAEWPEADFVVGNPPFIGAASMRRALGDGYTEALRRTWPEVPESADLVMYWWHKAAELAGQKEIQRFGLITTNSLRQTFNRRVIEKHLGAKKNSIALCFAIPDHPWVDVADGAAVRIAMTVGAAETGLGVLQTVINEEPTEDHDEIRVQLEEKQGVLHADLRVGANVAAAQPLRANAGIATRGVCLIGKDFVIDRGRGEALGFGVDGGIDKYIKPYETGSTVKYGYRGELVIDLQGLSVDEVRARFPQVYQWVYDRIRPERLTNREEYRRVNWWVFGRKHSDLRASLGGLEKYIVTVMTAKHRVFSFAMRGALPDQALIAIAIDDALHLGVLSSQLHVLWALEQGGRMGLGNDPRYNNSRCFDPFPFPAPTDEQAESIRNLAEQLDTHRKRQQETHPGLTLTGMYNVLEKLRSGDPLTAKEKTIHEQGLVSVLRQLHDELDAAVLAAYGWSDLEPLLRVAHGLDAPEEGTTQDEAKQVFTETVLERLVELNAQRAAEEAKGHIRWLRPEFQAPEAQPLKQQTELDTSVEQTAKAAPTAKAAAQAWPKDPIQQVKAVAEVLRDSPTPLSIDEVEARFKGRGKWRQRLPAMLDMLVAVGQAQLQNDRYIA